MPRIGKGWPWLPKIESEPPPPLYVLRSTVDEEGDESYMNEAAGDVAIVLLLPPAPPISTTFFVPIGDGCDCGCCDCGPPPRCCCCCWPEDMKCPPGSLENECDSPPAIAAPPWLCLLVRIGDDGDGGVPPMPMFPVPSLTMRLWPGGG